MNSFSPAEAAACRRLIELALGEDLGTVGDLTSQAVIPPDRQGQAAVVARTAGVVAGLPVIDLVLKALAPSATVQLLVDDGTALPRDGTHLAILRGPLGGILSAERIILNFLQHLSGIATMTRRYVEAVRGCRGAILDTRKTTPGWRLLEKYAVRCGGGQNHRLGLHDGILIKDNHLAAFDDRPAVIEQALRTARARAGPGIPVEVEVDTLDQLDQALAGKPDIVLLDNMDPGQLREAVRRRDAGAPGVLLEASGGVTLDTVRAIAETGVDRISVGALTHSAPALDIALDYQ